MEVEHHDAERVSIWRFANSSSTRSVRAARLPLTSTRSPGRADLRAGRPLPPPSRPRRFSLGRRSPPRSRSRPRPCRARSDGRCLTMPRSRRLPRGRGRLSAPSSAISPRTAIRWPSVSSSARVRSAALVDRLGVVTVVDELYSANRLDLQTRLGDGRGCEAGGAVLERNAKDAAGGDGEERVLHHVQTGHGQDRVAAMRAFEEGEFRAARRLSNFARLHLAGVDPGKEATLAAVRCAIASANSSPRFRIRVPLWPRGQAAARLSRVRSLRANP